MKSSEKDQNLDKLGFILTKFAFNPASNILETHRYQSYPALVPVTVLRVHLDVNQPNH